MYHASHFWHGTFLKKKKKKFTFRRKLLELENYAGLVICSLSFHQSSQSQTKIILTPYLAWEGMMKAL